MSEKPRSLKAMLRDDLPDRPVRDDHTVMEKYDLSPLAGFDHRGWTQATLMYQSIERGCRILALDYHPDEGWYLFTESNIRDASDALAQRREMYDFYETIPGIDTDEFLSKEDMASVLARITDTPQWEIRDAIRDETGGLR